MTGLDTVVGCRIVRADDDHGIVRFELDDGRTIVIYGGRDGLGNPDAWWDWESE